MPTKKGKTARRPRLQPKQRWQEGVLGEIPSATPRSERGGIEDYLEQVMDQLQDQYGDVRIRLAYRAKIGISKKLGDFFYATRDQIVDKLRDTIEKARSDGFPLELRGLHFLPHPELGELFLDLSIEQGQAAAPDDETLATPGEVRHILREQPSCENRLLVNEKPSIQIEEIAAAQIEAAELHSHVIRRVQILLDGLTGRKGKDVQENERISELVNDLAKQTGVDIVCKNEPVDIRWHGRVFEARTTDRKRKTLQSSASFPQLSARERQVERAEKHAASIT